MLKGLGVTWKTRLIKSCPLRAASLVVIPDTMPTMKKIAKGVGIEMGEAIL